MTEKEVLFSRQVSNYFETRRNKRRSRDSIAYEVNWVALLLRGLRRRADRTFRIEQNYAFLVSSPRWREIFATEFAGRMADHEVCDRLMLYVEEELCDRTYNNRKGKGAQAAINQVIEDMCEVSEGYTKPSWIIKLDFKGFFPNALWDYAERCIDNIIDKNIEDEEERSYLRWLTMVLIHANPAGHCELRSPRYLWAEHIAPEKSLLRKPEGIGAAIGRLIWQTAMGLYTNDEIRWLNETCGVRTVCFVDDIVMQVPERLKGYALSLIPVLRERLLSKGVRLNEKKFYCQPCGHGLEFLGSHIKPYRLHLNNKTYARALARVDELNGLEDKYGELDYFLSCVNSYLGLLKNRTDHKRLKRLKERISDEWWRYVEWDKQRLCVVFRDGYHRRERMNRKYRLRVSTS